MSIVMTLKRPTNQPINSEAANTDYEGEWPSLDEVKRMCQAINPDTKAPQFAGDWFQFFGSQYERTMHHLSRIYTATRFLEPDHQHLVMELENCFYLRMLPTMITMRASNTDMSVWASGLHDYFQKARSLQEYADANLSMTGKWEPL